MKIGKGLSVPIIFALLSGCAAQSIVVSKKAHVGVIEKGILYSLPKQLVKVIYTRKETDSGELKIEAEDPIPDTDHTFYAIIDHRSTYSDTVEISTKNGLLHGELMGHSEDKTGEIFVSLAGSVSGIPLPLLPFNFGVLSQPAKQKCPTTGATSGKQVEIKAIIDPRETEDLGVLNKQLKNECIQLTVAESDKSRIKNHEKKLKRLVSQNGLIYRQPGTVTFIVKRFNPLYPNPEIGRIRLNLAQGGQTGILPLPTGTFSENKSDVSFSNGMLSKIKIIQPSEVLGAIGIIPGALKAMLAIPTELIQLKVDYSSREKELLELKKTMLELQAEIDKKKLEYKKERSDE